MKITIQGYLTFEELLGKYQLDVAENSTLQQLIQFLEADGESLDLSNPISNAPARLHISTHQDSSQTKASIQPILLLNGVHLRHLSQGLNTPLHDGDHLSIFPPLAGG